jgi:ubiquinone biosynthesis protein UbiJ
MSDVTVDRLGIRAPLDPELGRRLGQLVAERLAEPLALMPGQAALERLNLELAALPDESVDALATRIAARLALSLIEAGP